MTPTQAPPKTGLNIVRLMELARAKRLADYEFVASHARRVLAPIADELQGLDEPFHVSEPRKIGQRPVVMWKVWTPELGALEIQCDGATVWLSDRALTDPVDEAQIGEILLRLAEARHAQGR